MCLLLSVCILKTAGGSKDSPLTQTKQISSSCLEAFLKSGCIWICSRKVIWWPCCVNGFGFGRCSGHCCIGVRHCWNLTLSVDLTGFKVLCHGIDLVDDNSVVEVSDGSSLMGSKNDGSPGDSSLIRGRGVSGCGNCGGVKNFSLTSVDSFSGFSRSSANVLRN